VAILHEAFHNLHRALGNECRIIALGVLKVEWWPGDEDEAFLANSLQTSLLVSPVLVKVHPAFWADERMR
jgi:hypothetical protein